MKWGRHPGRVRERLAALLLKKGVIVSPYDLWAQEGGYRHMHWDLARWGSNDARWEGGRAPDGTEYHGQVLLCSWSTMSECVRWGVAVGKFTDSWGHVDVEHARQPGQTSPRASKERAT